MRDAGPKLAGTLLLSLVVLAATASPALAAGVTIAEAKPWHYWISIVMLLSIVGIVLVVLPVGYYLKVWRLKHRGR